MKRFLMALVVLGVLASQVLGAGFDRQIIDQLLDDDPMGVTSSVVRIFEFKRTAFFVDYAESTATPSAVVTLEVSRDGDTWIAAAFKDFAGGIVTLQSSETISSTGTYYCWLDTDWCFPFVRMKVISSNTTATDIAEIDAFICGLE